jgi:hypothetical protein
MSEEWKRCPFLCEMRDLEIDGTSKVIGYICKGQCQGCKAHRPAEESMQAEVERLKDRVERLELLLFKIQETSTPHIGSIALYQAEMKAINRWCKLALGKDNNPDTKKGKSNE